MACYSTISGFNTIKCDRYKFIYSCQSDLREKSKSEIQGSDFSFDQVEIFANQTKEICLHLQSTIKDHQTRENNLFIENQGLKEHVKKIEFELNAEKFYDGFNYFLELKKITTRI